MRIRQATVEDLPKLKEIVDLSFPRFFRYFALHSVADLKEPTLVAQTNGELLGFAKLIEFEIRKAKYGCILWIAVHPQHRRQGIALNLTTEGVTLLKNRGAQAVFASTQKTNKPAQATLKKAEFTNIDFFGLSRLFGWHTLQFYKEIWYAPGEIVLMQLSACTCICVVQMLTAK